MPSGNYLRSICVACLVAGSLAFCVSPAQAALLGPGGSGLVNSNIADVTTQYMGIQYTLDANPATGTLHAGGSLQAYPDQFVADGNVLHQQFIDTNTSTFELTATINRADGSLVSGSVTITGDVPNTPYNGPTYSGTLLQGDADRLWFLLGSRGRVRLHHSCRQRGPAGSLLHRKHGRHGHAVGRQRAASLCGRLHLAPFQNNLDNTNGQADTLSLVPEPSFWILLALGLITACLAIAAPKQASCCLSSAHPFPTQTRDALTT